MTNEIVKYGNQLNSVSFRKFNSRELNLFFSIVSRMRDKGTATITFSFSNLKELSLYTDHGSRFIRDLDNTYTKMLSLNMWDDDGTILNRWVLFTGFSINRKAETVRVSVNPDLVGVLNQLSTWTRFSLEQFARLNSTYAKTMFRLLKQYRTVGKRKFSIEEFKGLLDIPKSYQLSDIDKRVLKPIREELAPIFKGLSIRKLRSGRGSKVIGFLCTFKKEIKNSDDFKHYNDKAQALNAIRNNTELTDQEKWRAEDRVLGQRLGTSEITAKKSQKAEEIAHAKHANQRDLIKSMLNGSFDYEKEIKEAFSDDADNNK